MIKRFDSKGLRQSAQRRKIDRLCALSVNPLTDNTYCCAKTAPLKGGGWLLRSAIRPPSPAGIGREKNNGGWALQNSSQRCDASRGRTRDSPKHHQGALALPEPKITKKESPHVVTFDA